MSDWKPHGPKQEDALFSKHPFTVVATGLQWGKTTVGSLWLKMMMHTFTEPTDNFIITSPTFPILAQSTLPPFLRLMEGYGKPNWKENCFKMNGGGTCWFRTGTQPDSVVGIPDVRAILCDEAGKYSLYFWENIQGRSDSKAAPIMIVTTPYSLNWLYKEIIRPKMKNPMARPDVLLIQAKSVENPYFNTERYYARQKTMDPRRFRMMYGGAWEKMDGLVYNCFDEHDNVCDPFDLPDGTRFVAGVDFGYTHPFVILVRAITPSGMHYQVSEFYQTQLTIDQKIEAARRLKSVWNIEVFYCDPARPDEIASFNQAKLRAVGAENAIQIGIERHYELIKSRRYKIFRGSSPHTEDEYATYHYPEFDDDFGVDDQDKEKGPVDRDNHCCDSARYVSMMTWKGGKQHKAVVADETKKDEDQHDRIVRLKRGRMRVGGGGENW